MHSVSLPPDGILHWDDFVVGKTIAFGSMRVERDDVIAYARAFDPQAHHLDETAAEESMLGGLSASGWHSCCMLMRLLADEVLQHSASLGSPGLEEVRWLKPVRPGDVINGRFTVNEKRTLASKPGVGLLRVLFEALNQHGQVAMTWDCIQFYRVRGGTAA